MTDTLMLTDPTPVLNTGEAEASHIIKTEPGESATAKIMEARVMGTAVEALCGHVFVPQKDPKRFPLCSKCKDIYDTYREFNNLKENPDA